MLFKLHRPMPVSSLIQRINEVTSLDCADPSNQQSLISLIIQQATDGQSECNSNRGLLWYLDSAYMFEVTAASHQYIFVTFEHPQEESTATAEIDLTDLCNARCMSIPVTMRAVMRKVAKEERKDSVMLIRRS
ncbi:Mediator of RNA polymerase II transcription subunit 1-like [Homarus americanus]|uniref:Mediator of RNA polymerase II transcription subunit 1-like n=1 Tax=Homarus americanus TaxID=6706 RepID=A0A8J5KGX5_HOMAM|nr:Mediator of RNA polymerase II transcription subunit 1-like [Homarus americanus]